MSLSDQIRTDLKDAMRAKDQARLSALRLLMAALKDEEGAKRQRALDKLVKDTGRELREIPADALPPEEPLTEAEMLQTVSREIKKRQDSAEAYTKAGRADLAAPEAAAIEILRGYMPAQMDPAEARARSKIALMDELLPSSSAKSSTARPCSAFEDNSPSLPGWSGRRASGGRTATC
jgi:uncharacterized protein YqeY